jgi:hypothetical protein
MSDDGHLAALTDAQRADLELFWKRRAPIMGERLNAYADWRIAELRGEDTVRDDPLPTLETPEIELLERVLRDLAAEHVGDQIGVHVNALLWTLSDELKRRH